MEEVIVAFKHLQDTGVVIFIISSACSLVWLLQTAWILKNDHRESQLVALIKITVGSTLGCIFQVSSTLLNYRFLFQLRESETAHLHLIDNDYSFVLWLCSVSLLLSCYNLRDTVLCTSWGHNIYTYLHATILKSPILYQGEWLTWRMGGAGLI